MISYIKRHLSGFNSPQGGGPAGGGGGIMAAASRPPVTSQPSSPMQAFTPYRNLQSPINVGNEIYNMNRGLMSNRQRITGNEGQGGK